VPIRVYELFGPNTPPHLLACNNKIEWALQDSNLRPIGYEPNPQAVQPFAAVDKNSESLVNGDPTESSRSQRIGGFIKKFVPSLSPTLKSIPGGAGHLLSVREIAARLGVSTATVYKLCDCGELPYVRVSNAIRVAPADLAEFIARNRRPSPN
jgi:excisionase family DNA binding protein